jgi:rhodanese-related sulfurtransferase
MSYRLLVIFCLLIWGCSNPATSQVEEINNQQLTQLMEDKEIQLVDVRTPEEVSQGIIEGAQNIDFRNADFKSNISELDKKKPIVVYCGAGIRSSKSATLLQELGFEEIYDLTGGFNQWEAENYPVAKP